MTAGHPIGTRCQIDCPASDAHGKLCTVISEVRLGPVLLDSGAVLLLRTQRVDIDGIGASHEEGLWVLHYCFEPHELIPIYNGNQKISWDECLWKPRDISVPSEEDAGIMASECYLNDRKGD